ncbi:hypothetical protein ACOMHN_054051 [Nucella lapillus]
MECPKAGILPLGVFLLWMLTSFLCHKLAKTAMDVYKKDLNSAQILLLPAVVTLSQMLCCWGAIKSRCTSPLHLTLLICHILATLATNTSMALTFASSTMAIKMLEPASSAVLQTVILNIPMGWQSVLSLLLVVCGAVMYVDSPLANGAVALAVVLAFLSNVILGIRNVTLKLSQQQQQCQQQDNYILRYWSSFSQLSAGVLLCLSLFFYLEKAAGIFRPNATYFLSLTLASGFFHVTYSYVSMKVVLSYMSVVSHAVANIFKRVLVILLLHVTGQRLTSPWNWTGLGLCAIGLCLYQRYKPTSVAVINSSGQAQNTPDYALRLLLGLEKWRDGQVLINQDVDFQPARKSLHKVKEFMRTKPLAQPFDTDGLSPYLTTSHAVIAEAQRLHISLFRDLLAGKKYAILFGAASFENKGDPAITVAEMVLLDKLGIELIFYIDIGHCNNEAANKSLTIARRYPAEQVAIVMNGGGNLIGYATENRCRALAMNYFKTYQQVLFSESIYMRASKTYFESAVKMYCCNPNLTILLRDRQSLFIAKRIFNNGTRLILAPDMAFHNGAVRRYVPPYYDIMWLNRHDGERPNYGALSTFPPNIKVDSGDWMNMPSLKGDRSSHKAVNVLLHGYAILQRGRVVITERLHGHILCVLLDIPHVLLDNNDLKLSSYYNTWTRGISNCRLANSALQAVDLAKELLRTYNESLPQLLSATHLREG